MRPPVTALLALLTTLLAVPLALAHGQGLGTSVETRFQLPTWVVWTAGGAVVALSFLVVAGYVTRRPGALPPHATAHGPRPPNHGWVGILLALPLVPIAAGHDADYAVALIWLFTWILLPMASYTFGNLYARLDPLGPLERLVDPARGNRAPSHRPGLEWVSVAGLLAIIGLEVTDRASTDTAHLARLGLLYITLSILGMLAFGSSAWRRHADPLAAMFRWFAAAAWLRVRPPARRTTDQIRARLEALAPTTWAGTSFAVALLYGVNFDGIMATPTGALILTRIAAATSATLATATMLLTGFALFLAAYVLLVSWLKRYVQSAQPLRLLAGRFAPSLLPITIGYHLAHNLFGLIEQLPRILGAPLSLVPGAPVPQPVLLPPAGALYATIQLLLILAGHVAAVLVAHAIAMRTFPSRVMAVRSELPMGVVMVTYTLTGLAVLSASGAAA